MDKSFCSKSVLVIADVWSKQSENSVARLVSKANQLSEKLNTVVNVCMFGVEIDDSIQMIKAYGVKNIFYKKFGDTSQITDEKLTNLSYELIKKIEPQIVLYPITVRMKSISARLAARLETGLTADCIDFSIDSETNLLLQKRPAFEDSVIATITCPDKLPQMATANPLSFELKEKTIDEIEVVNIDDFSFKTKDKVSVLEIEKIGEETIDEEGKSKIVVGIGRGVNKDDLQQIKLLVKKLNARLVASRAVVDNGLLDYKYQIGLSGKEITCETYIAFGISGMMQHMSGLKSYKNLIAVNTDESARIMSFANYGICDTTENVVKHMLNYLENRN
ncbi:electron transfer flavoprotein subunit alpha/FixB family protein [Clostridium felsineum]|uniref:electron transfer flavoprotein subunit alpha/FixB family protein n=1 Tax=Clostridium felsineum TaxID=36839 RepID=UPI0009C8FF11|nr:electron transfer flavoprotein subunit alpha/FixB family protein [Clostridium felsineum]URZ14540.1 Caffeyl-CoA reductase-Etf complex subunit CarE [Clostridium felsineum DSM 794]